VFDNIVLRMSATEIHKMAPRIIISVIIIGFIIIEIRGKE
jgi:hypothetical protein